MGVIIIVLIVLFIIHLVFGWIGVIIAVILAALIFLLAANSAKSKGLTPPSNQSKIQNINGALYFGEQTQKLTFNQLEKYMNVMDSHLSAEYLAANLHGQNSFNVGKGLIAQWEEELAKEKQKKRTLSETTDNNNKGIALEKVGDIDGAINIYEKNLETGYPALHSYERLMILYRKQKNYNDEIRVIENALEIFDDYSLYDIYREKWNERLEKAYELNLK